MTNTTSAGDYRITITKSEKYRIAQDGNPNNILGRTAGCRRLMYNRMLNATKARTNKKGKHTWHTPNYPAFLDKENENETYLLEVPKQVYAQAFVDLQTRTPKPRQQPQTLRNPKIRQQKPTRIIPTLQHKHRRKTRRRRHPLA